ncbi:MAG TPA: carboxymuconolactone decarboxylase family protein [Acidimicrobiales bacterium]|jgi:alkylhydroperoxidase family enzyme|nr:carboxymuconolactone decarboxylase family protein [Acidimicrobiales bacterium]
MPRYEPIPVDQLSSEARSIIDAGIASGMYDDGAGLPPAQLRVMAYNTTVLKATAAQSTELWHRGLVDNRLKELIRIRSAQVNGCDACASRIKEPGVDANDVACMAIPGGGSMGEPEMAVLALVAQVANDHHGVDEDTLRSLGRWFSPAEVVELVYHVCVMLGQHRFHHVFRSYEEGEPVVVFEAALVDAPMPKRADEPAGGEGAALLPH